ncbi:MAG: hypothetical protein AAF543_13820 [Pseudomonadota bacterium]
MSTLSTKTVFSCAAVLLALSAQHAAAVPFTLEQTLNNPTPGLFDQFGYSASLSDDGSIALVGARNDNTGAGNAGSAYLYDTTTGNLLQTLNNPTPEASDQFGRSVSLSGDGSTALVGAAADDTGAFNAGSAYLFDVSTGNLLQTLNNPTPVGGDQFGFSVSLSADGSTALVGSVFDYTGTTNTGSAYLFDVSTGNLLQTLNNPTPAGGDQFGYSVSLSADGSTALVGARTDDTGAVNAGSAYLFDVSTGNLLQTLNNPTPATGDIFGESVSLSADGSTALVGAFNDDTGATNTGSAYLFDTATGNLLQTINNPTPATSDQFGVSVSLSGDGSTALVGAAADDTGANAAGSAYLFDAANGALLQTLNNPTPASSDLFGFPVSLSGDGSTALIGAISDDTGAQGAGSAYVYRDQAVDLPAPGSLLLLGSTLAVMAGLRLRRRRQGEG